MSLKILCRYSQVSTKNGHNAGQGTWSRDADWARSNGRWAMNLGLNACAHRQGRASPAGGDVIWHHPLWRAVVWVTMVLCAARTPICVYLPRSSGLASPTTEPTRVRVLD